VESYPEAFLARMRAWLGPEGYRAFREALERPSWQGLRINTRKTDRESFLAMSPFALQPIPWVREGFYYFTPSRPGRHPFHAAGVYYIQEPSAMAVAPALNPEPGDRVLDLCAAPGGKATHLGALLQGKGLLVANEPHPQRVHILAENIERFGIVNALVTNETPERLAKRFPAFFDKILVDAPCSGEGMFRKDPASRDEWSLLRVESCAARQRTILHAAAQMLRPGGTLVYATCTFAPEENEGVIESFLRTQEGFEVEEIPAARRFFSPGHPDWVEKGRVDLVLTARLWPHLQDGEGHFIARLRKTGGQAAASPVKRRRSSSLPAEARASYRQFAESTLRRIPDGEFLLFGAQLYLLPPGVPDLDGIRVVRPGWHLGTWKKSRLEPGHALALGLGSGEAWQTLDLPADSPEVYRYLQGQTLERKGPEGWVLVTVERFPLGWAKRSGGVLKNHYPKGLRWLG
jgi:NOL1/NOP2/sun family putative RNA methylase